MRHARPPSNARMLSPRDIAHAPRFLSVKDIRDDLGVSLATAYRYMREMYALRTGGIVRVTRQRYEAWLRKRSGWAAEENPSGESTSETVSGGESSPKSEARRTAKRSGFPSRSTRKMMLLRSGSPEPSEIVQPRPLTRRHESAPCSTRTSRSRSGAVAAKRR